MTVKKLFTVVVAVLLALSTFVLSPPVIAAGATPIYMPDGSKRSDMTLSHISSTDKLIIGNYGDSTVLVEYSDPVYGSQTATLAPDGEVTMCSDFDHSSHRVIVTFGVNTAIPATGYGYYSSSSWAWQDLSVLQSKVAEAKVVAKKVKKRLQKAKKAVAKAKATARKAKASHRLVWFRNATRWLKKTETRLKKIKAKHVVAKAKLKKAKSDLSFMQEEMAFCSARRVS
jgi:mannose-1-phosphate guanylyltransferase